MTFSMLLSSHKLIKVLAYIGLAAVLIAFFRPRLATGFFSRIEKRFRRLAQNKRHAMLAAAAFPMLVRALMLPWYPPPPPQIHDEFSYLLQADTFAHGRMANPTPPEWQHFESEYVLFTPAYASQYQPAQGVVLAFGEAIFRNPWFGVWLSIGVMCAAIVWALGFVLPPVWALFGGLLAALQFGIFGLWMNSYFGGAVSTSAGALVLGSLVRMRIPGKTRSSGAMCAFGIITLFASRPLEGLLWSLISAVFVLRPIKGLPPRPALRELLPAFFIVFTTGALLLAYYNWRITGNPALPPYLAYQRIYGTPQPFWWQGPLHIDHFNYAVIRDNYLNQLRLYELRSSWLALLTAESRRLLDFWKFFIGPLFTPALLFIPFLFRDRRVRPWLWVSIPFILDKATFHAWFPAHNGPATILILMMMTQCWRYMLVWLRSRRTGVAVSRYLLTAFCVVIALGGIGRAAEPVSREARHLAPIWESLYPARRLRDDVHAKLQKFPGKHLVFVLYSADHCFCEEWVFNSADIRNQRIVYVRSYSPESDARLANYLKDHDVWVVEPDTHPYRLFRVDNSILTAGLDRIQADDTSPEERRFGSDLFNFSQHEGDSNLP